MFFFKLAVAEGKADIVYLELELKKNIWSWSREKMVQPATLLDFNKF